MDENRAHTLDQTTRDMAEARGKMDAIEEAWKNARAWHKTLTIRLVTEHGLSVAKAADISGSHRNTVSLWVQIHNAEEKARKKSLS